MSYRLDNQTVVITGASGGIGQATALRLAEAGAHILLHANRNVEVLQKIRDKIVAIGSLCDIFVADFSDSRESERFCQKIDEVPMSIDHWINAAGIDLMADRYRSWSFEKKLEQLLLVDVITPIKLSKKIGDRMKKDRGGTILFFGWDGVDYGRSGETSQLYGLSKGAIQGFCRSLHETLAPEVRVHCLSLGWIRTRWGKTTSDEFEKRVVADSLRERWGEPEEVAEMVLFLTSRVSSYLDGINIHFNGGKRGTR